MKILDGDNLRDMTADELAEHKATVADAKTQTAAHLAQAAAKKSAETKLAALGLTADEITALYGIGG